MTPLSSRFAPVVSLGFLAFFASSPLPAAVPVTLHTGSISDLANYEVTTTWHLGSTVVSNEGIYVVGIPVEITSYGTQTGLHWNRIAFCAELEEDLSLDKTYDYDQVETSTLSPHTLGLNHSAWGAAIASNGVGATKADYVQILFDKYYGSSDPTASYWSTNNQIAFQLALWKLTHEDWTANNATTLLKLGNNGNSPLTGNHFGFYASTNPSPSSAFDLAQTWVNAVIAAQVAGTYSEIGTWTLMPLSKESTTSPPDVDQQDLMTVVPEPGSNAVLGGMGLLFCLVSQRSRQQTLHRGNRRAALV